MKKIGGVALLAAVVLSGCAAPEAKPATESAVQWVTKDGKSFDISKMSFEDSAIPAFKEAASKIPGYATASDETLAALGRDLCEHYAGGFTTDDLRAFSVSGKDSAEALAQIGEAAKATVCAKP